MKIRRVRPDQKKAKTEDQCDPKDRRLKKPWEKGYKGSGGAGGKVPMRDGDIPPHLTKQWKPKPGKDGVMQERDTAEVKRIAATLQHEVLRHFRDGHLNTGDFARWVRSSRINMTMFYSWVLKDLIPKSVALSVVGGDGTTPDELPIMVRIESRDKAPAKKA